MNTKNKLKPVFAVLGLGFALASGPAAAQSVTWFSEFTTFQDDNLDFVYEDVADANGNLGTISVGDVLVSALEVYQTSGINPIAGPANIGPDELTGVLAVQAIAVIDKDGDGQIDDVEFGPYALGLNSILALGGAAPLPSSNLDLSGGLNPGAAGGGAIAAFYLDPLNDFNALGATSCPEGLATCITQASNGALFQVDGFGGDLDNYWYATSAAGLAYASVAAGGPAAPFTLIDFGGDTFWRNLDEHVLTDETVPCSPAAILFNQCNGDQLVWVQGSGNVLGGQGLSAEGGDASRPSIFEANPADRAPFARSDFDYTKEVAVPEPEIMALLAAGLLGMAASRRKKLA